MAIYQDTYRPWQGTPQGRVRRIAVVFLENFWLAIKNRWALVVVITSLVFAFGFILLFMVFAGRGAEFLKQMRPEFFGNNAYRYYMNWDLSGFFPVMVAALVGSGIIASDVRHNAHLMYLARPLTKNDYVIGKFLTIAAYLAGCTFVPGMVLFFANILFAIEELTFAQHLKDALAILGHSVAVVVPYSLVLMALSCLSRTTFAAGVAWVVVYFVSMMFGHVLSQLSGERMYYMLSIDKCIEHIGWVIYEPRNRPEHWARDFPHDVEASIAVLAGLCLVSIMVIYSKVRRLEEA